MARLLPRKDESLQLRDVTIHWQLCIQRVDFSCWRHYLLIYLLKETVTRERERQDKVYWRTFNAIEHFGAQPDKDSEQKAKAEQSTRDNVVAVLPSSTSERSRHDFHSQRKTTARTAAVSK